MTAAAELENALPDIDELSRTAWHVTEGERVLEIVRSGREGLAQRQVELRRERFGANVVPTMGRVSLLRILGHQFLNPLIYILIIATIISLAIGKVTDAVFIIIVILLNAGLGAFQEWRAERSAEALQRMLRVYARLRREGQNREVDAEELVPGDIVVLEAGDKVPADLRLLELTQFRTDESFLTGESIAAKKQVEPIGEKEVPPADRVNMAFAGATVTGGRGVGVVVATGLRTEIGRIAEAVTETTATRPPLVIRMERFVRNIGLIVIGAAVVLAAVALWQGRDAEEVFFLAVALAVSAIPEGLPVAMTVALSVAVYRMSRRHVIVRRMPAVEGLGSCTYLASDKTGTLTVNRQTVKLIWLPAERRFTVGGEGYEPEGQVDPEDGAAASDQSRQDLENLARVVAISNDAGLRHDEQEWKHHGDPLEVALLALAFKLGVDPNELRKQVAIAGEIPFESERKYAAKFYRDDGAVKVVAKGAVERMLEFSDEMVTEHGRAKLDREAIERQAVQLAHEGYRVLAIAMGEMPSDGPFDEQHLPRLTFLGLVGMIDPLRPEAALAVENCKRAGVEVAMITGDHPVTAAAISKQLGIIESADEVVTGRDLEQFEPESEQFARKVRSAHVFARVAPLQKLDIVEALGRLGHFTAVTGDGVNDAPALRRANIGVAMGSGTDVAKDAAPIIVTDDNFASIVSGIEEGRYAYANIRKVIYLLVSTGAAEIVLFLLAIVAGYPLPLLPVQILWLNLVTNGIQDKALAFEAGEPEAMQCPPRRPTERIFNRLMIWEVAVAGAWMGLVCFGVFVWLTGREWDPADARNVILMLMVLFQNFHLFNARSEQRSTFRIALGKNPLLILGIAGALGVHLLSMHIPIMQRVLGVSPLDWRTILLLAILAATMLAVMELFKLIRSRFT